MPSFFRYSIVRLPCQNISAGLCEVPSEQPVYSVAVQQHKTYIQALEETGVQVIVLPPEERYPDSCFVEDTMICTPEFVVFCNSVEASRNGEVSLIKDANLDFANRDVYQIRSPGFLEGGDVMMVGKKVFVGISNRTNEQGVLQLDAIVRNYGWETIRIAFSDMLHLKTGMSYLENNMLLIREDWMKHNAFSAFDKIPVPHNETAAANCVWLNGFVIMPAGYPRTKYQLTSAGYKVLSVPISEFQKIDGGVSCLSVRF